MDDTPGAYKERPGIGEYVERGYMPNNDASRGDHQRVGGSVTLEWAIDDFAIAQLAKAAGDKDTAATFTRRGQNWQNILNPATGYLQPRGEDGRFPDGPAYQPPPPGKFGQDGFDEGNAAQYNWLVPQDTEGLIAAMGGRDAAADRLDTFFTKLNAGPNEPYMWAGNEVDFGVPWVYNHLGMPWKTQKAVRDVATTLFSPTPDGRARQRRPRSPVLLVRVGRARPVPVDTRHTGSRRAQPALRARGPRSARQGAGVGHPRPAGVGRRAVRPRARARRPHLGAHLPPAVRGEGRGAPRLHAVRHAGQDLGDVREGRAALVPLG